MSISIANRREQNNGEFFFHRKDQVGGIFSVDGKKAKLINKTGNELQFALLENGKYNRQSSKNDLITLLANDPETESRVKKIGTFKKIR